MADILSNLSTTLSSGLKNLGQQNNQFRSAAAQQNNSISRFIKDIGRYFSSQSQQQNAMNSTIGDLSQSVAMNSAKIDQTNSLMRESISVQNQMLIELRNTSNYFRKFSDQFHGSQDSNNSWLSTIANILGKATGIAVAGAGIAALGSLTGIDNALAGTAGALSNGASNFTNAVFGGGASGGAAGGGSSGKFSDTVGSNQRGAGGNIISVADMVKIAKNAGFTDDQAVIMGAIGGAESSGRTTAHNTKGRDDSYGIWQINMKGDLGPERRKKYNLSSDEDLYNATLNAKIAKDLFDQAGGFTPWGAFTDGRYQQYLGTAQKSLKEGDENSAPTGTLVQKSDAMNSTRSGVQELQHQLAGVRRLPLSSKLKSVLDQAAAAAGVEVVVYSGGQVAKGSGGPRTGSTRHDNGNAADLYLMKDGRKLSDVNPQDRAIMAKFVSSAVSSGATGVGAGHGYMGSSNIHVGFGKQATWGGAPWIQSAASGVFNNKDLTAESGGNTEYGSPSTSATGPGGMFGGENNVPENGLLGTPLAGLDSALFGAASSIMGGAGMLTGAITGAMGGGMGIMGAMGGIGDILQGLIPSLFSSGSFNKNEENDSAETIKPTEQQTAAKTEKIQTAAVQSDSLMHNLSRSIDNSSTKQTTVAQAEASLPTRADQARYSTSYGITASPSWYLQLAGRITNDETMKMKGGVYV